MRSLIFLTIMLLGALPCFALEAGLASQHIEVRSDFNGMQIIIFGTLASDRGKQDNVAILVRGPKRQGTIWKKQRIAGVWINTQPKNIGRFESFHAIATSMPSKIASFAFRQKDASQEAQALRLLLAKRGLLFTKPQGVEFLGRRLFRANIQLPPNAPIGDYQVVIALLREAVPIKQIVLPLYLDKTGWGQFLFWLAHEWSFFYGLAAIGIALLLGWSMSVFLRRLF